jgi:hypothetical protein
MEEEAAEEAGELIPQLVLELAAQADLAMVQQEAPQVKDQVVLAL